jgi:acetyltransferase-like isoleucine patch superfamily enzyme
VRLYNLAEAAPERQSILARLLGHVGHESIIESPFHYVYGQNIHIGDHVYLNV